MRASPLSSWRWCFVQRAGWRGSVCRAGARHRPWSSLRHGAPETQTEKEGTPGIFRSSAELAKTTQGEISASSITWVGASINGILGLGKLTAGVYGNSASLIADAAHSLSDLISDFVTLAALKVAQRPPDSTHPFGYGRYETIGAFTVSGILIMSAGGTAMHSLDLLVPAWSSVPHAHPGLVVPFHSFGIAVAASSIVSKEILYRKTMRIARRLRSKVLEANAWHHRTDALSSVVALVALLGSSIGYHFLDPIGGLVVSGMIFKAGANIGLESVQDLADGNKHNSKLKEEIKRLIKELAVNSGGEVTGCHSIRTRRVGAEIFVDLCIFVDEKLTVSAAHNASERISQCIEESIEEVEEVMVHVEFEPHARHNAVIMRPHPEIERDVRAVVMQIPQIWGVTHVRSHFWENKVHVELEIEIADRFSVQEAKKIGEDARNRILESISDISSADVHLEL